MIGLVKGKSSLWIKSEVTEGTYVAPASASDALEVLEEGLDFQMTRDVIERNTLSATIESEAPRVGLKTVTGSVPVEFKAAGVEGAAPREDLLYKGLLGARRQIAAPVTSKAAGHTSTSIKIEDADIGNFSKNMIVLVKNPGKYEVRPISSVTTTLGSAAINFPFALEYGAPVGATVIAKMTQYYHDDAAPTLSFTHYLDEEIEQQVTGCRVLSGSLENWTTAQVPTWSMEVEGIDLDRNVASPAFTPNFSSDALPPVLLGACLYLNGIEVEYNELSMSVENSKADIPSACNTAGKVGTRLTNFKVSGSVTPYMEDDDVVRFDAFNLNSSVSLFAFAYNPSATAGEGSNWIAFWIPTAKITENTPDDIDGVVTESISFQAFKNEGNDTLFLSFV